MPAHHVICGSLRLPVGWSAGMHRHAHPELLLVTQGAMRVEIDGVEHAVAAGQAVLYPSGVRHRERASGTRPLSMHYLHADLAAGAAPVLDDASGRIAQLVRWLAEDLASAASSAAVAAWLEALRQQIARSGARPTMVVEEVRAALRARPAAAHRLGRLALAAGMSSRQLLRRYRAETGSTPMADLRRLRCAAAADLLVSTDWGLQRIAREVGFGDAFHLSRVFRACYGTPPGRMRRLAGGGALSGA